MRLLVWNIQFFTLGRIQNDTGATQMEQWYNQTVAESNRDHIVSTVTLADPDVFIIIEPRSQQAANVNTVGELASGGGPDGLQYLYQLLHNLNNNWYLVPPLKTVNKDIHSTTYTEAVGFFYRGDRFDFTGPWVWPAARPNRGPSVPPGNNVNTANYPNPWAGMLPANTQYASQARFYNNQQEITFPNASNRRPVLSTFRQRNVQQPVTYKIFACHTTPNTEARAASARMLGLAEATPGDREVSAVVGDFNVDIRAVVNGAFIGEMDLLYDFDGLFVANDGPTTVWNVNSAEPTAYLKTAAYDNIFVRYGTNTQRPQNHNKAIINRVAGSQRFPSDMFTPLTSYSPQMDPFNRDLNFRLSANYGHIGNFPGTSDHLAIVADV